MLFDRASGRRFSVTPRWELSISAFRWLPDAPAVLAEVEERGGQAIYRIEVPTGRSTRLVRGGTNSSLQVASAAEVMVFLRSTARRGPEVWAATLDGKIATLSLGEAKLPCIADLPPLKTVLVESPTGPTPYGGKAIAENPNVPTAAAIANAIADACGVRMFELPLSAEKIYWAMNRKE